MEFLRNLLALPETRGLDLDDPSTTVLRRNIIQKKSFLKKIYTEWYVSIRMFLPTVRAPVLEIGSGAGFLREYIPDLIPSELFVCPYIKAVVDGQRLPFASSSLRAIVMTDVLHHLPDVRSFFSEAARCIKKDGRIIMIEPWVTRWSRVVYTHFHHEPFSSAAPSWNFPAQGPLSGANDALPWIIFTRDRQSFEKEFPQWGIVSIRPFMPLRYLVSGGVSMRSLTPEWSYGFWKRVEDTLSPWNGSLGMFAEIVLQRNDICVPAAKSGTDCNTRR